MTTAAKSPKGLEGIVAADTRLSDVKGDIGELIYAGYNINELAGNVSYEEVIHLLHENRLPTQSELAAPSECLGPTKALGMRRAFGSALSL